MTYTIKASHSKKFSSFDGPMIQKKIIVDSVTQKNKLKKFKYLKLKRDERKSINTLIV